jgi:hypothetical protein
MPKPAVAGRLIGSAPEEEAGEGPHREAHEDEREKEDDADRAHTERHGCSRRHGIHAERYARIA